MTPHRPAPKHAATAVAHRFEWHGTGHNLLEAKLRAIAAAKSSVRMETYTFTDSDIGRCFRDALAQAAQRGAKVKLLVDAVGSLGLAGDFFAPLVAAGGEMRWFNPLSLSSFSFRDHRKLLVLDDAVAFAGGCNIAPEYHGDGITAGWRDGGVAVRGPVVSLLGGEFDIQWERAGTQGWGFRKRGVRGAVTCGEVTGLFIKPGFGANPLRTSLRKTLATAKDVAITSAYFLPSRRLRRLLVRVAKRGARVRLLLAGRSDVALMQLASRSLYRRLIRAGIEVWEYQPQVLHAKLIVADSVVFVGSSNLDPRSLRINFEIMLRIEDRKLAAAARERFEEDLAERSLRITLESMRGPRSWWRRFKQRLAYWLLARLDGELAVRKLRAWRRRLQETGLRLRRSRRSVDA